MGLDFFHTHFINVCCIDHCFYDGFIKDPKYFEDFMCVPLVGCVTWRFGSVFLIVNVSLCSGCITSLFQLCVFLSCFSE